MSKRKKMTEVLEVEMLAIAKEKETLQSMEAAQKKKARKEVKKAARSAVLMDLSKKFTTVSKTWAVAPNEELEPPSLGLSTPNLSYLTTTASLTLSTSLRSSAPLLCWI